MTDERLFLITGENLKSWIVKREIDIDDTKQLSPEEIKKAKEKAFKEVYESINLPTCFDEGVIRKTLDSFAEALLGVKS